MKYNIFSICTEEYKDALNLVIPYWSQHSNVDMIYIYTDFEVHVSDPKVRIVPKLEKTVKWIDAVGLKATALQYFLKSYYVSEFVFLDIDCFLVKDVSEVFSYNFDIAPTRMYGKKVANSGVWFCKRSKALERFTEEWISLQNHYRKLGIGIQSHRSPYEQISFSNIVHREHEKNQYLKVHPLDENIYNCESDDTTEWLNKVNLYKPKIIHFKGRRWREPSLLQILKQQ